MSSIREYLKTILWTQRHSGSSKSIQMTDEQFIEFCYQKILRRNPDEGGKTHYTNALSLGQFTREDMMIQFITSQEFKSKLATLEFVHPGHFYSAIPSLEEREAFLTSIPSDDDEIPGVNLNTQKQIELLNQFKSYYNEWPFPEHKTEQFRYYFSNPSYSYSDALTLYCMIRHFRPKRIVEIGSGFSSSVMLDTSDSFLNSEINFTFIDPYPTLLHSLLKQADKRHTVIPKKLQEVDKNVFFNLESNDILFVDSTHVSKLNSDVNKIIFDLLVSLQKDVLVHFHDIYWPFEYPREWVREGRAWNEAYILRAFLEFNESYEVLFFYDYLYRHQLQWFQENMPLCLKDTGKNIWIRKVKA